MRFEFGITRRNCLRMLLAVPGLGRPPVTYQRYYQAQAQILFCGMTIFSKKDVGGGYAVAEEIVREGQTDIALQFAGGSWPVKAHGVNKLGYIQETVTERASGEPVRAEYFAFMTSAPEKNFEQAKRGFLEKGEKPVPFNAAGGLASGGTWNFRVSHLLLSSSWTFSQFGELDREVRRAVAGDRHSVRSQARSGANTFLNSLRRALRSSAETTEHSLVYNGKAYEMRCTKQTDGALMRFERHA